MKTIMFVSIGELLVTKGGIHRVTDCLIKALEARGYKCIYLATSLDGKKFYRDNVEDDPHLIPTPGLKDFIVNNEVDIIVNQQAFSSSYFSTLFKSFNLSDVKYITVFHNTVLYNSKIFTKDRMLYEYRNSKCLKRKLLNGVKYGFYPIWKRYSFHETGKLYTENYNASDKCVFLSDNELPYLAKYLGHAVDDRCVVIHNPLTFDFVNDKNCLAKKKKNVLVVARLNNFEKRLDMVLKIWKHVEAAGLLDWSLYIVGWGLQEKMLHDMAEDLNLKNVHFEGRQPSEPYYEKASIFMMTSAVEGWGLTLTESMQTGVVPMAFNSYPALPDIITDGYDGLIIPNNDIDAYADKLINLMRDKDNRERMALSGLTSCRRFEMDKIVDQWVKMIESL